MQLLFCIVGYMFLAEKKTVCAGEQVLVCKALFACASHRSKERGAPRYLLSFLMHFNLTCEQQHRNKFNSFLNGKENGDFNGTCE